MKGVLLKDLYIAKSNILVTVVSLVVLGFGLSFLLETSALLVLAPVASTTAVFISITSDAASKWNKNVITMPVSRGQIIGEKFVFYILLAVLGLVTALIPCLILGAFGVDMTFHSLCLYGSIGISATLLAGGISLPCAYLFDPDHCGDRAAHQSVSSREREYPVGVSHCTCHFRCLVLYLLSGRSKGISETGYYLSGSIFPPDQRAAAAAPLAFLRGKTFHDISAAFHDIGGCIPAPLLLF